jgi:hypothetical protein
MNDATQIELRKLVERVVRPIVAMRASKRTMREELLAHLSAVFADELTVTNDETAALESTRRRFGEAAQTTRDLQSSISTYQRVCARLERYTQPMWEPGDTLARLMGRYAAQFGVNLAILLPLMLALTALAPRPASVEFALTCSVAFSIILPIFVGSFTFIPVNFGDAMFGPPAKRSRVCVSLYALLGLLSLPLMAFSFYYVLTGDLAASLRHGLIGCYLAPANLFLFVVAGRLAYQQMAGDHEWARLKLDE